MKMTKRLIAVLTASVALFALAGCSMNASSTTSEPKDYAQIIHDARPDEDNENQLILSTDGKGGFTATDGYSSDMTAEDCKSQADNFILPMLGLAEGDYESFAASVSLMNVRSYAVAIVKPAEGKAQDVQQALEDYVTGQQMSMQNYLADQYEIAKAAKVTTGKFGRRPERHRGRPGRLICSRFPPSPQQKAAAGCFLCRKYAIILSVSNDDTL